jgi:hypothetical protein
VVWVKNYAAGGLLLLPYFSFVFGDFAVVFVC